MRAIKLTIFNFFTFLRLINNECNLILHPTNHRVLYGMKVEKKKRLFEPRLTFNVVTTMASS